MNLYVTKNRNKIQRWTRKFIIEYNDVYDYPLKDINISQDSVYCIVKIGIKEIAFLRMQKSYGWMNEIYPSSKLLNVIYVDPKFRHQKIAKQVVEIAMRRFKVKFICLKIDRFRDNYQYFSDMGFTNFVKYDLNIDDHGFAITREASDKLSDLK